LSKHLNDYVTVKLYNVMKIWHILEDACLLRRFVSNWQLLCDAEETCAAGWRYSDYD